jgi:hypothetical protein
MTTGKQPDSDSWKWQSAKVMDKDVHRVSVVATVLDASDKVLPVLGVVNWRQCGPWDKKELSIRSKEMNKVPLTILGLVHGAIRHFHWLVEPLMVRALSPRYISRATVQSPN